LGREVNFGDLSLELFDKLPVRGGDVYLTLDLSLQRVAKEALKDKTGAVVAMDPETGAVLAMYSSPSYDLTQLSTRERSSYWARLATDPSRPLYNRAVQGMYPPASAYKIITATAALEEGLVDRKERIRCHGGLRFGNRVYGCWRTGGHGAMDIISGLTWSCDVFFYTMGIRLGVDKIAKYAKLFGLGEKTGIELPGEKRGLVPTKAWKLKARKAEWNPGETLSVAIGQGYNLTTPLQMALVTAEVANRGYKIRPHLVEKIVGPDEKLLYEWTLKKEKIEEISTETMDTVREGMLSVVNSGTGRRLKALKLDVAGKSGTAQVVSKKANKGIRAHKAHAWFVGFAPFDNPKIAVAVLVEHGGGGSSTAGPIVGKIIKEYLNPGGDEGK
jgi:penicillin-binding protein 2